MLEKIYLGNYIHVRETRKRDNKMTVFKKDNTTNNEYLEKVFNIVPDFKMYVTRNAKIDGRIGCGLGYNVKLQTSNGSYSTVFNNSKAEGFNIPHPEGILNCILSDASIIGYADNFKDFCLELGYEEYTENRYGNIVINKEALNSFNACVRTNEALNKLFTSEQLDELYTVFEDY